MAPDEPEAPCTGAHLFGLIWDGICDVLGAAATAALIQRSLKRAAKRRPELAALAVTRVKFDYEFTLPDYWSQPGGPAMDELGEMTRELGPMLVELTGPVVLRRLTSIPAIQQSKLAFEQEHT